MKYMEAWKRIRSDWTLIILGFLLVAWAGAQMLSGSGVQARLDARQGIVQKPFVASMEKAVDRMTPAQVTALEWALGRLDDETLLIRYGQFPRVRQVIVGEVMQTLDETRRALSYVEKPKPVEPERIEEVRREKLLEKLNTIVPVVTHTGYVDARENGLTVQYRVENPPGIPLESLPCRLIFHVRHADRVGEMKFDCMAQWTTPNGDFHMVLPGVQAFEAKDMVISLVPISEEAIVGTLGSSVSAYPNWSEVPAHKYSEIAEIRDLAELRLAELRLAKLRVDTRTLAKLGAEGRRLAKLLMKTALQHKSSI